MFERQWQYLRDQLRLADTDRPAVETRYAALGNVRAVLVAYLRDRLNQRLLGGVQTFTVPGQIGVTFASGNVQALERWIARVEAGPLDPSDPDAVVPESEGIPATVVTLRPSPVHDRRRRRGPLHPDLW